MEISKTEVKLLQDVETTVKQESLEQLADLQMAFVGGGIGDVILG